MSAIAELMKGKGGDKAPRGQSKPKADSEHSDGYSAAERAAFKSMMSSAKDGDDDGAWDAWQSLKKFRDD